MTYTVVAFSPWERLFSDILSELQPLSPLPRFVSAQATCMCCIVAAGRCLLFPWAAFLNFIVARLSSLPGVPPGGLGEGRSVKGKVGARGCGEQPAVVTVTPGRG